MARPHIGIGFRTRHAAEIIAAPPALDWFEVNADNFIGIGGPRRATLERLRADYPIVLHGLSLSVAGTDPLARDYLDELRALAAWSEPTWVSDHLCWTGLGGHESHDLLPVAYTAEVLGHVAARVSRVQDVLQRPLLLENPSAYVAFAADEMSEAEFLAALCRRTGCGLLLDVNNLYVNACNLDVDPAHYLQALDGVTVGYMHLAGHAILPDVRIDTHDADVPDGVWDLFAAAVHRFPDAGIIVERDDNLPPLERLVAEAEAARAKFATARDGRAVGCEYPRTPPSHPPGPAISPRCSSSHAWSTLQRGFFARVVDQPLGFDHAADGSLGALLDCDRPVRAARGMRVYSDAYTMSLRRALTTNFPALATVLSRRDFAALAGAYLRAHPPRGHDFTGLGHALPAFVAAFDFADTYGVDATALGDLAALEQATLEAQHERDDVSAPAPDGLRAIPLSQWGELRFDLSPALRVVQTTSDVLPATQAVARGEPPARPGAGPTAYLLYRDGEHVQTLAVDPFDARLVHKLAAGTPFAEAVALVGLGIVDDEAAAHAAARVLLLLEALRLVRRVTGGDPAASESPS